MFNNSELNKLFNELDNISIENKCMICQDNLIVGTNTLICGHKFHTSCLREINTGYNSKCPYCQKSINWNYFKGKCNIKKKKGGLCGKVCFSDEGICAYHINLKLKNYEKNKTRDKKELLENKEKLEKQIKNIKEKINKLLANLDNKLESKKEIDLYIKMNNSKNN